MYWKGEKQKEIMSTEKEGTENKCKNEAKFLLKLYKYVIKKGG